MSPRIPRSFSGGNVTIFMLRISSILETNESRRESSFRGLSFLFPDFLAMNKALIKSKGLFPLGLGLVILMATSIKVFAQVEFERYPTTAEIQKLREKLRQQIQALENSGEVQDSRTLAEKQRREAFVRAWSRVDPSAAPFLGNWLGYEEGLSIYPSNTRGRVCLIYIAPTEAELRLGTVSNGQIRTTDGAILLQEGDYIAIAHVSDNQADIPVEIPYHSPRVLESARQFAQSSATNAQQVNQVVRAFNSAGCTASLPSQR